MKRFPLVLAGTVAGLAGILGFHPRTSTGALTVSTSSGSSNSGSGASSTGSGSATTPTTAPPSSNNPSTSSSTTPSTTPSTTTPPAAAAVARSSTGTNEQYGYGALSVKVTVVGNKITNITVPSLQTAEQYSQQIANQVIPMLRSEVLKAQSTNINGISGATYTAEAYVTSLQSALTNLHFK